MREVNGVDFPRKSIDATKWLIVIALVEELDLVSIASTSKNDIIILLTELAGVEETWCGRNFQSIPVEGLVELAFSCLPLLELVALFP